MNLRDDGVQAFLGPQMHLATEHFGRIDPLDLTNTSRTTASPRCGTRS